MFLIYNFIEFLHLSISLLCLDAHRWSLPTNQWWNRRWIRSLPNRSCRLLLRNPSNLSYSHPNRISERPARCRWCRKMNPAKRWLHQCPIELFRHAKNAKKKFFLMALISHCSIEIVLHLQSLHFHSPWIEAFLYRCRSLFCSSLCCHCAALSFGNRSSSAQRGASWRLFLKWIDVNDVIRKCVSGFTCWNIFQQPCDFIMAFSDNTDTVELLDVIADLWKIPMKSSKKIKVESQIYLNVWYFIDDAALLDPLDKSVSRAVVRNR